MEQKNDLINHCLSCGSENIYVHQTNKRQNPYLYYIQCKECGEDYEINMEYLIKPPNREKQGEDSNLYGGEGNGQGE